MPGEQLLQGYGIVELDLQRPLALLERGDAPLQQRLQQGEQPDTLPEQRFQQRLDGQLGDFAFGLLDDGSGHRPGRRADVDQLALLLVEHHHPQAQLGEIAAHQIQPLAQASRRLEPTPFAPQPSADGLAGAGELDACAAVAQRGRHPVPGLLHGREIEPVTGQPRGLGHQFLTQRPVFARRARGQTRGRCQLSLAFGQLEDQGFDLLPSQVGDARLQHLHPLRMQPLTVTQLPQGQLVEALAAGRGVLLQKAQLQVGLRTLQLAFPAQAADLG
jgi:hypothetical protein